MYPYYIGSLIGNWTPGRYSAPTLTGNVITGFTGFVSPGGANGNPPFTVAGASTVPILGLTTNIALTGGATLYITNGSVEAYH
jgi:hypothetical protein